MNALVMNVISGIARRRRLKLGHVYARVVRAGEGTRQARRDCGGHRANRRRLSA
jgi:hypothetical protein